MIAVQDNADHAERDEAFARIEVQYIRITRVIPICCGRQMVRRGEGPGRVRYYRCPVCMGHASGTTIKENLH